MQSWQTDLVNTYLSLSLKPALRHVSSLRAIRAAISLVDKTVGRLMSPRKTEIKRLGSPSNNCELNWISRSDSPGETQRVILYLPGGAYVMRTQNLHAGLCSRICKVAKAEALVCYYRLAPEHPFPAGLEDALEAYDLLLDRGIAPENMFRTEVRVDIWRKVPHVWVAMPVLPESADAIARIGDFLKNQMPCP